MFYPSSIRTIKDDTMKCAKAYFKKCGTPLHRELSDLVMDVIMHRVTQFCDNSQQKSSKKDHVLLLEFNNKTVFDCDIDD